MLESHFYCCKTKLVVWSKSGRNLTIGSSHNRWGLILAVGSHLTSIWTIRCIWNWLLELGPNLDGQINMGKLGVVGLVAGGGTDFLKKLEKYWRNKSKYHRFFAIGGDFFKKIFDFSAPTNFWWNFWMSLSSTFCHPLSYRRCLKHEIWTKF